MPASDPRSVPAPAREVARRVVAMFERDRERAIALNDAQRRLLEATDQLTLGLSAEALIAIYGPTGPDIGLSGRKPAVLEDREPIAALERVAATIRSASVDYQHAAEDRRALGFDVGAANAELLTAMVDAGFSPAEARNADVHRLASGVYRPVERDPRDSPRQSRS